MLEGDKHPFGQSVDYDVLIDGERLPPKAVFGFAATEALGFRVTPYHFKAGKGSPCFAALEEAGYEILPKDPKATPKPVAMQPLAPDQDWAEGSEKLRIHMGRERKVGLAKAKKADFKAEHGKLFCQRCSTDLSHVNPEPARDAGFEIHHAKVMVADMPKGHRTKLEDLECLCATCHRVVHWELRQAEKAVAQLFGTQQINSENVLVDLSDDGAAGA